MCFSPDKKVKLVARTATYICVVDVNLIPTLTVLTSVTTLICKFWYTHSQG